MKQGNNKEDIIAMGIKMRIKGCSKLTVLTWLKEEIGLQNTAAYAYYNEMSEELTKIYAIDVENVRQERIAFIQARIEKATMANIERDVKDWTKMLNEIQGLTQQEVNVNVRTFSAKIGGFDDAISED